MAKSLYKRNSRASASWSMGVQEPMAADELVCNGSSLGRSAYQCLRFPGALLTGLWFEGSRCSRPSWSCLIASNEKKIMYNKSSVEIRPSIIQFIITSAGALTEFNGSLIWTPRCRVLTPPNYCTKRATRKSKSPCVPPEKNVPF